MNARSLHQTDTAASEGATATPGSSIFRIDSFECPIAHRAAFEDRLAIIHRYFDTLPGCLYNRVALSAGENEAMVKIVTIVEWCDRRTLDEAKTAIGAFYAKSGFDPAAFMAERGIAGLFGTYLPMER